MVASKEYFVRKDQSCSKGMNYDIGCQHYFMIENIGKNVLVNGIVDSFISRIELASLACGICVFNL